MTSNLLSAQKKKNCDYSDSHKTFPEGVLKWDSSRSWARKSVDLMHSNGPRSCERSDGHSHDSEITFENRYMSPPNPA